MRSSFRIRRVSDKSACVSRKKAFQQIVSKVILRHANLSTTQRYLGKVSDMEAMRWIDNLHG